jgi:hypothetical protein
VQADFDGPLGETQLRSLVVKVEISPGRLTPTITVDPVELGAALHPQGGADRQWVVQMAAARWLSPGAKMPARSCS